jgi:multidrug efflux pump subunit AcrA (membrane-fusion protein)
MDAVIIAGDLSQSIGSPVSRGEALFHLAPTEGYRVVLEVDERDIIDLAVGQKGVLVLAALAEDDLPLVVSRITPVSAAGEGRNAFRVEARLDRPDARLRPGMEGVAKVAVGRRRLMWILGHRFWDWWRLRVWSWLP